MAWERLSIASPTGLRRNPSQATRATDFAVPHAPGSWQEVAPPWKAKSQSHTLGRFGMSTLHDWKEQTKRRAFLTFRIGEETCKLEVEPLTRFFWISDWPDWQWRFQLDSVLLDWAA